MERRRKGTGSITCRNGVYYYSNKAHGIKKTSLKTTDKDEAIVIVSERWGYLKHQEQADKIRQGLEKLEDVDNRVKEALNKRDESLATVFIKDAESLIQPYMDAQILDAGTRERHVTAGAEGLSYSTIKTIQATLRHFCRWMIEEKITQLKDLTEKQARDYAKILRREFSDNSYAGKLATLKKCCRILKVDAGLRFNPFESIDAPKNKKVETVKLPFSHEQMKMIYDYSKEHEDDYHVSWIRSAGLLAYFTGLRFNDVCALKWEYFEVKGSIVVIKLPTRKGRGKEIIVTAPYNVWEELVYWRDQLEPKIPYQLLSHKANRVHISKDYVWPLQAGRVTRDNGQISSMSRTFALLLVKLDIVAPEGSKYGFHSYRKAHATDVNRITQDRARVQMALGHSDQRTGDTYVFESENEEIVKAIASHLPLSFDDEVDSDAVILAQIKQLACSLKDMELRKKIENL